MSIVTDLYATLNANSGVRAIVGQATSPQQSKIYPNLAPESAAVPFIVTFMVSGRKIDTLAGVSDAERQHIQISCFQSTYELSQTLADAVEAALQGNGFLLHKFDRYEDDTQIHGVVIDWSFIK